MAKRVRIDQIPSTPDELYVQLYCERKGAHDEETIQKAKHSWMSLSSSKKKLFNNTIENKHFLNYAHGLSKSKIYLKERKTKKRLVHDEHKPELDQNVTVLSSNEQPENTSLLVENPLGTENEDNRTNFGETQNKPKLELCEEPGEASVDVNINPLFELTHSNQLNEEHQETQSSISSCQRAAEILVEPAPPRVKTAKEFYEVVKRPEDPLWTQMTMGERNRYHSAVYAIKRNYIKNYMKYLESLPQQQLFDHYMKTLH